MNLKEFKIGDSVYLIDGSGIHVLEVNVSYKIVEIKTRGDQTIIALEGIENESGTYQKYPFFNSRRFESDIRPIRKKKLQKIYDSIKTY